MPSETKRISPPKHKAYHARFVKTAWGSLRYDEIIQASLTDQAGNTQIASGESIIEIKTNEIETRCQHFAAHARLINGWQASKHIHLERFIQCQVLTLSITCSLGAPTNTHCVCHTYPLFWVKHCNAGFFRHLEVFSPLLLMNSQTPTSIKIL